MSPSDAAMREAPRAESAPRGSARTPPPRPPARAARLGQSFDVYRGGCKDVDTHQPIARIKALMARGFHKPGDVENRLGYYLGQIAR